MVSNRSRAWLRMSKHNDYELSAAQRLETIETAIYQLEQLERVLDMPERGYVRNGYNAVLRTLREGR